MKVGAHPLVVAVALGLLGPHALAEEERAEGESEGTACRDDAWPTEPAAGACGDCDCARAITNHRDPLDVAAIENAWSALSR